MPGEFPTINIMGDEFIVDVFKEELRMKSDPDVVLKLDKMISGESGQGYSFFYYPGLKSLYPVGDIVQWELDNEWPEFGIPDLVKIDPVGMAEKYGLSVEEVKDRTDWELKTKTERPAQKIIINDDLPTVEISGDEFTVDVLTERLQMKTDPGVVLEIDKMSYEGNGKGYSFYYYPGFRSLLRKGDIEELGSGRKWPEVSIPELVHIDPLGMAGKYHLTLDQVKGMTDLDLKTGQDSPLKQRWKSDTLPTIDIMGKTFYIDIEQDKLRPKDDPVSKGIAFSDLDPYYSIRYDDYIFPYNPLKGEVQEIDKKSLRELPSDVVYVEIPGPQSLDIAGFIQKYGGSVNDIVASDIMMHQTARVLDWSETDLPERIKYNVGRQLAADHLERLNENLNIFKTPTDAGRNLPTTNILGTDFIVDVNQLELRQKDNEKNVISFRDMRERDRCGYEFEYNPVKSSLTDTSDKDKVTVKIPDFVQLDRAGMALKYNLRSDEIKDKTDFDLMVDPVLLEEMKTMRMKQTIDIAGTVYYINHTDKKLVPKDDIWLKAINFSDLKPYYNTPETGYFIPYNKSSKCFEEISLNAKEIPKDLIVVRIPDWTELNPVLHKKSGLFDESGWLKKRFLKLHFKADIILWQTLRFAETVKQNLKQSTGHATEKKRIDARSENPESRKIKRPKL